MGVRGSRLGEGQHHDSVLKALAVGAIGRFDSLHRSACESTARALGDAKLFIAIVSSVKLIMVTLPSLAKAQRASRITDHLERTKAVQLPKSLWDYFIRELKKSTTGKKGQGI